MICIGNQTSCWAGTAMRPFEYALANAFDAFEWFPDKKPGMGWDESDLDQAQRSFIRETAREHGVRLSVHARWQANPLQPQSYPMLDKDLALARDIGAVLLNIHLFHEAGLEAYIKSITPLTRRVAEAGLQLSIENTPYHSPELFNELFAQLRALGASPDDSTGMCLDLGHANLCAATQNDYLKFLDRLEPHVPIIHLHLHENWGDADSHLPLFTGPAGQNDSGIRGFLTRIQQRHFAGSMILEQWPQPPTLLNQARDRLLKLLNEETGREKAPALPLTRLRERDHQSQQCAEPEVRQGAEAPNNEQAFLNELVAADKRSRSWREKLAAVHSLLLKASARQSTLTNHQSPVTIQESPVTNHQSPITNSQSPITIEQLAYVAIYLRFLSTGEIPCAEDGRHFRPGNHADVARKIQELLSGLSGPDMAFITRKIYPWLPSSAQAFRRAEPLTRIRDIAHRNDIPADLKREIKHSLQNKLHRCAGPEDLATSAALLKRITAPEAGSPSEFVTQFKIFHDELKEFFNARSLEERLGALLPNVGDELARLIQSFLDQKAERTSAGQEKAFERLTDLRGKLLDKVRTKSNAESQDFLLAEIALEDFAFALLSQVLNEFEATPQWEPMLDTLQFTIRNLELSSVSPEECGVLKSELHAWRRGFDPADREQLLRLRATLARCGRLSEDFSKRIIALFPERVKNLGQSLSVANDAIQVFCEAEIRGHLVFQLSKLVSNLLRRIRRKLALPPWDVLVIGKTVGRLKTAGALDELHQEPEPVIALVERAEGDEEIPSRVRAIILAHPIPHLSHLGVRARQARVVFVTSEDPVDLEKLRTNEGQILSLIAGAEKVEWSIPPSNILVPNLPETLQLRAADPAPIVLEQQQPWIPLERVSIETGGAKADGARRLTEIARQNGAGFQVPPALVIPFGVMETCLESTPELLKQYHDAVSKMDALDSERLESAAGYLQDIVQQISFPEAITAALASQFNPRDRLIVRSSANCEDLEEFAGAGLYDSVPNVALPEITAAIRKVWASLWSRRAVLSRRQAGIAHSQAHMAVLVQRMLCPDYSFVVHTVNPLNSNSGEVYVELVIGLGEALVSASARGTPYRFVCHKTSGAVTTLAFADFSYALECAPAGGHQPRTVNYSTIELSLNAAARNGLIQRLARIAGRVENHFQKPQDIEGCVVDSEFYLVQSRPQQGLPQQGMDKRPA